MKDLKNIVMSLFWGTLMLSCKQQNPAGQPKPEGPVFAKGEKITNDNFAGTVWLNRLINADSLNPNAVGSVIFEPGARTKWHSHPAGQIILALDGIGY
ncbi:hypothetical protein [Terrimonas sp.]|uniref:hypothetical protein n=1 Tax=Terrimonas sp. TaxID=1914338 RepID=UPI001F0B9551|nr:hypothetical protein [Terrimonas sp.]